MTGFPPSADVARDDIHLVYVDVSCPRDDAIEALDAEERERAGRFHFEADRRRFVGAHAALRIVLGRVARCRGAALAFAAGPHGKPALAGAHQAIRFNLSHAGERALIAVTLAREVGVDIEQERPIDHAALARRFFSPAEREAIAALPDEERSPAFFRVWARKEAFIKALGEGITFPLADFDVSVDREPAGDVLRECRQPRADGRWRIAPVAVERGYAAAVAAEAGPWRVVRWDGIAA